MAVVTVPKIKNTLFLYVTCSLEKTRELAAVQASETVLREMQINGLMNHFIMFDNRSTHTRHMKIWPDNTNLFVASKNIGYWSAIYWVLQNYQRLLNRSYKYIYIMESDCLQYDVHKLAGCEQWLDNNPNAGAVRCQEYSRRLWFLFDKRFKRLPFHKTNSAVAHYNGATNQKIVFGPRDRETGIFETNFHSKLPAVNRVQHMNEVFARLLQKRHFGEGDFMQECQKVFEVVGVLDGGTFRAMGNKPSTKMVTGSYSYKDDLKKIGYRATRSDRLITSGFDVQARRN